MNQRLASSTSESNPYDIVIEHWNPVELANLGWSILVKYQGTNNRTRDISARFRWAMVPYMASYPELHNTPAWEEIRRQDPQNYSYNKKWKEDLNYIFSQVVSTDDMYELWRIMDRLRELWSYPHGVDGRSTANVVDTVIKRVMSLEALKPLEQ